MGIRAGIAFLLFFISLSVLSQEVEYRTHTFHIKKSHSFAPSAIQADWQPHLQNLEMPAPGGNSYRSRLQQLKKEIRKKYPVKSNGKSYHKTNSSDAPDLIQGKNFGLFHWYLTDVPLNGGTPNDNTIAISNDGMLLTAYNSTIYGYDTNADTLIMQHPTLHAFTSEFTLSDKYDPKLLYDPIADRFILVFLNGRTSEENLIIVGFSSTNHPADEWHFYGIPGNPLNDTTWTDYPAINITEDELFITGNLLRDGEPWQTGFSQSIIWQIDKETGYNGDSTLTTKLWNDIKYDGQYIRNIHPVRGAEKPLGPNMYLLSNKNFSTQSDSIFLIEVTGKMDNDSTELTVQLGHTSPAYGMPPNGRQKDNHEFDTNDSRVLGAFVKNNKIQYVSNTIDTSSGLAAVYHGFIDSITGDSPHFTGNIIGDGNLDFGYPNIVYTGKQDCDEEAIISFNHTAPDVFAGYSAIHYTNNDTYSPLLTVKDGYNYVDRITGTYERWGDYSGIQLKYDEPGTVWTAAYYGLDNNNNSIWVSEISSPDTNIMSVNMIDSTDQSLYNLCDGMLEVEAKGGNEPYSYSWNITSQTSEKAEELCSGSYTVTVTDDFGCSFTTTTTIEEPEPETNVFPNPVNERFEVNFELKEEKNLLVEIYDTRGRLVKQLYRDKAKKGRNVFTFNTSPLMHGVYLLKVTSEDGEELLSEKIVKN